MFIEVSNKVQYKSVIIVMYKTVFMKYLLLLITLTLLISCKKEVPQFKRAPHIASKVDELKNAHDVEWYIYERDTNYNSFQLQTLFEYKDDNKFKQDSLVKLYAAKFNVDKSYYKEDFDNNGYTDLLVIGDTHWCADVTCQFACYAVMNFGGDSIQVCNLVKDIFHYPIVPQVVFDNGKPLIKINELQYTDYRGKIYKDSLNVELTYYKGNFTEYNKKPANNKIEKIEFAKSGCYGTCPSFQINIEKDRSAIFIAQYYNFSEDGYHEEGSFKAVINQADYDKIVDILNYIDFSKLDNEYSEDVTDLSSALLKVTYDNGKVKIIRDYGLQGTYGLMALYNLFYKLRFNQKWVETEEPKGIRLNPLG